MFGGEIRLDPPQHDIVAGGDLRRPAGLNDDCLVRFDQNGGPREGCTGRDLTAQVDRGLLPRSLSEDT